MTQESDLQMYFFIPTNYVGFITAVFHSKHPCLHCFFRKFEPVRHFFFLPFTTSLKGNSLTKLHLQVLPALAVVCRSSGGHLVVPWLRLGCGEPSSRSPFQEKTPVPLLIGHPGCQLPPRLCVGGRGRLPVWDRLPYIE